MGIAIKAENISKAYQLGEIGTGTISRDIERWISRVRGKEDPFLKIGETNDRTTKGNSDIVWSLKDISFDIEQGDAVGIIGRNGAGKSTLLKVLSKVTSPTSGRITGKGRIASLLEVGTGFHPELTGRENIYLNGAILGMRKREITRKFDEIIEFAGVERYIDTPVKRYSSGMYVRLAFAVAAHLDSEILIVDEVLAVGDAEFQTKCLGKMGEVSEGEGRTVLFVSHNMGSISKLCKKSMLLQNGEVTSYDYTDKTIAKYISTNQILPIENIENMIKRVGSQEVVFANFKITNIEGKKINTLLTGEKVYFEFALKVNSKNANKINIGFSIHDVYDEMLTVNYSGYQNIFYDSDNKSDYLVVKYLYENINLSPGKYEIKGRVEANSIESDWPNDAIGSFSVEMGDYYKTGNLGHYQTKTKFLTKGIWA